MFDGGDIECVAVVVEAKAVVAKAQAELGRLDVLEAFYVTLAGGCEVGQGAEKSQGGGLVDGAELGLVWGRQSIFLRFMLTVPDGAVRVREVCGPCARNPRWSGQTRPELPH